MTDVVNAGILVAKGMKGNVAILFLYLTLFVVGLTNDKHDCLVVFSATIKFLPRTCGRFFFGLNCGVAPEAKSTLRRGYV